MATSQNTQQQIDQFNAELDKIEQKIVDSGKLNLFLNSKYQRLSLSIK